MVAARLARQIAENTATFLATELFTAARGIDLRYVIIWCSARCGARSYEQIRRLSLTNPGLRFGEQDYVYRDFVAASTVAVYLYDENDR